MTGTSSPTDISTRLQQIAELARRTLEALTRLAHHIDIDFLREAYGFRRARSTHDALQALWDGLMKMHGGWVLEIDIEAFFGLGGQVKSGQLWTGQIRPVAPG